MPEERIYEGFQGSVIKAIIDEQRKKCEMMRQTGEVTTCPFVLLILDDIIGDTHLNWEEELRDLAFAGRHFYIACWITSQDCKGLGPAIRSQADILGISYTTSKRVMDAVKEDYAYLFRDPKLIPNLVKTNTMNHQFLIIDQSEAHYAAEEMFFVDKAPDPKSSSATSPYKIGSDKFWSDAGCSWENQLKTYAKIPQYEKKDWLKVAKQQLADEIKEDQQGEEFEHYSIEMASKEAREAYRQNFKQKFDSRPDSREKVKDFIGRVHRGYHPTKGY